MKTRDAVIDYQSTEKDTATYKKDLDLVEPISAIDIEVESTNGATSNEDNFISDIVTKIEIVDGSEVLHYTNMAQLQALQYYKTGKFPCIFPSEWASGTQRETARILFGRELWDPEFGFDCRKFNNPKLQVTFNKAAIRAAGATGYAAGDNIKITAVAKVFEDGVSPSKFLQTKQVESFTSAASGEKRIDLPVDLPYRLLMLRAWIEGSDVDEVISNAKLTFDTDKFIQFDRKVKQLDAVAFSEFGLFTYKHDFFRGGSFTARVIPNKEPQVVGFVKTPGTPRVIVPWAQWSSNYNGELYDVATPSLDGTARQITGIVQGHAPHATVPILFGRRDVPSDWFDPTKYKKMELVLTQATVSAVCEVVVEQVRSY